MIKTMIRNLLTICSVLLLAACSSPKYAYYFDHHDYNNGKKGDLKESAVLQSEIQPLHVDNATLVASADEKAFVPAETATAEVTAKSIIEKYKSMSGAERKEFRKELKKEVKTLVKMKKKETYSVEATKRMDNDLKIAAIFGAVGLVLTLFGGVNSAFWVLGVIAIVIAVVFLVKWLVRQ